LLEIDDFINAGADVRAMMDENQDWWDAKYDLRIIMISYMALTFINH